jgi:hypothetical protein
MKQVYRTRPIILVFLLFIAALMTACSGALAQDAGHSFTMSPLEEMPEAVQQAPTTVQEAYRFAVANPDVTRQIPCYCGCGAMGHTSNYSCFVTDSGATGEMTFDEHALGCSICVDIAQDTMRLLDEGKPVDEIFTYIDNSYARFGPPTSSVQ